MMKIFKKKGAINELLIKTYISYLFRKIVIFENLNFYIFPRDCQL